MDDCGVALGYIAVPASEDEKNQAAAREGLNGLLKLSGLLEFEDVTPERLDEVWKYFIEHAFDRFSDALSVYADTVTELIAECWNATSQSGHRPDSSP